MGESELGKRGSHIAQKTVERVTEQAEELRKTDIGQAVHKVSLLLYCLVSIYTCIADTSSPVGSRDSEGGVIG